MKQPDIKEIKAKAKAIIKGKMGEIWKPLAIIFGVSILGSFIINNFFTTTITCPDSILNISLSSGYICTKPTILGQIIDIIVSIVVILFGYGFVKYLLNFVRNKEYDIKNDLFYFFKNKLWLCILTSFLVGLFTSLWTILLIVPGIIAAIAYSLYMPLVVDGSEKALETIKKSKSLMKGHKWNYFVFLLSFIGWYLLTFITFGIAAIYLLPFLSTSQMLYYEEIKKMN